jgi:predicted DNA-binding transcriptional regulator AlpA
MFDQPMPQIRGRYYKNKDLQSLFNVSRATIDRWCRTNPEFPQKNQTGLARNGE